MDVIVTGCHLKRGRAVCLCCACVRSQLEKRYRRCHVPVCRSHEQGRVVFLIISARLDIGSSSNEQLGKLNEAELGGKKERCVPFVIAAGWIVPSAKQMSNGLNIVSRNCFV